MDDLFSHLERELSEPENERTVSSFWRCVVRPRLIKRTVTTHNDELSTVLRHPWGVSWRKAKGKYWCPICCSLSAEEMLKLVAQTEWWNPVTSMMEFHKLVERGEMDSSSRYAMYDPPPGYGYGLYTFTEGNEPVAFTLVQSGNSKITVSMKHLLDLDEAPLARLLQHMNRLAPYLHWSLGVGKRVQWSFIAYAPGLEMSATVGGVPDDDDDEPDDEDDPVFGPDPDDPESSN